MGVLKDCRITGQTSNVLREYVGEKSDPNFKKYGGYQSGIDIEAKHVYAMSPGTVVFVGRSDKTYSVIVRNDPKRYLMYSNLKTVLVASGDDVDLGDKLGDASKFVRVEYVTTKKSKWPVRINDTTYYKNDPTDIVYSGRFVGVSNPLSIMTDSSYIDRTEEDFVNYQAVNPHR